MAEPKPAELTPEQRSLVDEVIQAAASYPPAEQVRIVAERAGTDEAVRREAISILKWMSGVGDDGFLEQPVYAPSPEAAQREAPDDVTSDYRGRAERPREENAFEPRDVGVGSQVGPYRLVSQVGEGGFGVVWLAEQTEPIRRPVALKVIKPGMDSKQVIARFEQERQALAIMDHPGIARVYSSGTTEHGRPYFAMEYIAGEPITKHCDKNRLSIDERIELFVQVCDAVDHAHERGVVHRDLKPSNVLVAYQGEEPVVKVIDFGVAKALTQPLTDSPCYTLIGQAIGTPEYMSPEQAEMDRQSIDRRSDVYSLGAMLYELLCGSPPFDPRDLRSGGASRMRETIRSQQPLPPSERVKRLGGGPEGHGGHGGHGGLGGPGGPGGDGQSPTTVALEEDRWNVALGGVSEKRKVAPRRLVKILRNDLDALVLKCLEKRREKRYARASDLARDLRKYIEGRTLNDLDREDVIEDAEVKPKNRAIVVGAPGVALVALLGGALWFALGRGGEREATPPVVNGPGTSATTTTETPADPHVTPVSAPGEPADDPPTLAEPPVDLVEQARALVPLETITIEGAADGRTLIVSGWVVNEDELEIIRRRLAVLGAPLLLEAKAEVAEVRRRIGRALEEAGARNLRVTDRRRPDWGPHYVQVWLTPTAEFDLDAARALGRRYVLDATNIVITAIPE